MAVKAGEEVAQPQGNNPVQVIGETIAAALDMSVEDLQTEIQAGKTFAEMIEEKGGDLEGISADILTALEGTPFLEREGAEERLNNILNGQGQGGGQRQQQQGEGE